MTDLLLTLLCQWPVNMGKTNTTLALKEAQLTTSPESQGTDKVPAYKQDLEMENLKWKQDQNRVKLTTNPQPSKGPFFMVQLSKEKNKLLRKELPQKVPGKSSSMDSGDQPFLLLWPYQCSIACAKGHKTAIIKGKNEKTRAENSPVHIA